jgi:hypothetical protein
MLIEYSGIRAKDHAIDMLVALPELQYAAKEIIGFFLGDEIGSGGSRRVYEHPFDETKVIKVAVAGKLENVYEWMIWCDANKAQRKWLARCHFLSKHGMVLIQERAQPLPQDYKLPKKLPSFINKDTKPHNFGLIDGRLVCVDYALARTKFSLKPESVKWGANQ